MYGVWLEDHGFLGFLGTVSHLQMTLLGTYRFLGTVLVVANLHVIEAQV